MAMSTGWVDATGAIEWPQHDADQVQIRCAFAIPCELCALRVSAVNQEPMKTFRASIDVMPHDNLLDPQGKAVTGAMPNLGLAEITGVRIGKHITLHVEAADKKAAEAKVDEACKKLLANLIMEKYSFAIEEQA